MAVLLVDRTTLVRRSGDEIPKTNRVLTDARGAILLGLQEYVQDLKVTATQGGRKVAFARVLKDWPEREQDYTPPMAVVYSEDEGEYDPVGSKPLTPTLDPAGLRTGEFLLHSADFSLSLGLWGRCTESAERIQLMKAVEDALNPVDWMHGCRLVLPHYGSVTADFQVVSNRTVDSADESGARNRTFEFRLVGRVSVIHLRKYVKGRAAANVEIVDSLE